MMEALTAFHVLIIGAGTSILGDAYSIGPESHLTRLVGTTGLLVGQGLRKVYPLIVTTQTTSTN